LAMDVIRGKRLERKGNRCRYRNTEERKALLKTTIVSGRGLTLGDVAGILGPNKDMDEAPGVKTPTSSIPFYRRIIGLFLLAAGLLFLAALPCFPDIPCVFTGVDKVVAVGDLHGDYQNFLKILTGTNVVDQDLHWIAGRTHLVQTGDILDRGPSARRIFDLLIQLEKEAEQAGGHVHVLTGNHEEMAIGRISHEFQGYVTADQFKSFLPDEYVEKREKEYRDKKMAGLPPGAEQPAIHIEEIQRYWEGIIKDDEGARKLYYDCLHKEYGAWLIGHNAVIKINDTVFAHGGISESFSTMPLEEINSGFRSELELAMRGAHFRNRFVYVQDSPLWYRGLALSDEQSMAKEVDRILANLKARHQVIAHTPHGFGTLRTMERFGGKVWVIDTGISAIYGGHYSALIIESQKFRTWGVVNGAK